MTVAEMSGGLAGVLHVIIDYLTTRKQFDQYIGGYQSLKHPTVQILLSMEACRSHLPRGDGVAAGDTAAEEAVRVAKAQGSEAFALLGTELCSSTVGSAPTSVMHSCTYVTMVSISIWDTAYHRELLAQVLLNQAV